MACPPMPLTGWESHRARCKWEEHRFLSPVLIQSNSSERQRQSSQEIDWSEVFCNKELERQRNSFSEELDENIDTTLVFTLNMKLELLGS